MNVGILFEIIQWFTVKGDDTGLALSANQSPTLRNVSPLSLSDNAICLSGIRIQPALISQCLHQIYIRIHPTRP